MYDMDFLSVRLVINDHWNGELRDVDLFFSIINNTDGRDVGKMGDNNNQLPQPDEQVQSLGGIWQWAFLFHASATWLKGLI